jgi:hypothetical protein
MVDIAKPHSSAVTATEAPNATQAPVPHTGAAGPWLWMSVAAATIAATANIAALAGIGDVYARETASFVNQALAQDIISLTIVCPAIIVSALLARRGSMTAYLLWLGAMSFTVYNYVIYTLSIHAGALFLPWVAVLGLSLFALTGGLAALDWHAVKARFAAAPRRTTGWFLIVVAVLFTGLWLKDIIPALLSGQTPAGARDLGLPSSPVHVLDLAFYLPATFAAGLGLLRDRKLGYATAPALLIFLALTAMPIMLTPFIASARGHTPGWAILAPMAAITIASLTIVIRLLSAAREQRRPLPLPPTEVSA